MSARGPGDLRHRAHPAHRAHPELAAALRAGSPIDAARGCLDVPGGRSLSDLPLARRGSRGLGRRRQRATSTSTTASGPWRSATPTRRWSPRSEAPRAAAPISPPTTETTRALRRGALPPLPPERSGSPTAAPRRPWTRSGWPAGATGRDASSRSKAPTTATTTRSVLREPARRRPTGPVEAPVLRAGVARASPRHGGGRTAAVPLQRPGGDRAALRGPGGRSPLHPRARDDEHRHRLPRPGYLAGVRELCTRYGRGPHLRRGEDAGPPSRPAAPAERFGVHPTWPASPSRLPAVCRRAFGGRPT